MGDLPPDYVKSILRMRYLPISPVDHLYLDVFGHGNDARFADVFRDVWLTIPVKERKRMTGYWATHICITPWRGVRISLQNSSKMRNSRTYAECGALGAVLEFYAPVVDRMPRKHVAALIAHELAHVLQASNGQLIPTKRPEWMDDKSIAELAAINGESFGETERKWRYQFSPVERDADTIAMRWGFNVPAEKRWLKKKVRWDDMPEPVWP